MPVGSRIPAVAAAAARFVGYSTAVVTGVVAVTVVVAAVAFVPFSVAAAAVPVVGVKFLLLLLRSLG